MRAYIRPLGEPNRCLNVYASYDCGGDAARRRPHAALVQARLPPHLRDRPRRRQGGRDQRPPRRSRPAAAERDVGGLPKAPVAVDLEPAARRLADRPPEPAPPLLPRLDDWVDWVGHRLLLRLPGMEGADRPLQPLRRQALRDHRVGRRKRRRPAPSSASSSTWVEQPPALQDARLLPGLRLAPAATGSRTTRPASRCSRTASTPALPRLRAGRAAPTAAPAGRARARASARDLRRLLAFGALRPPA